jgi:uncharacterized protein (DUF697 family)
MTLSATLPAISSTSITTDDDDNIGVAERIENADATQAAAAAEAADAEQQARALIQRYALSAGGVGFVPVPLFDQITVGALCGKMIYDLGQIYQVPTPKYRIKATLVAVLGGAHTQWITYFVMGVTTFLLPGLAFLGTLAVRPLLSGAITHTVGHIFLRQFAKGKTLENFDTAAAAEEFQRGFEEGKTYMRQQLAAVKK